jgi:hypothetical protein
LIACLRRVLAIGALGEVHGTHAAATELAHDGPRTQSRARRQRGLRDGEFRCRATNRIRQDPVCAVVRAQERRDFIAKIGVTTAGLIEVRRARRRGLGGRDGKQLLDTGPAGRVHQE